MPSISAHEQSIKSIFSNDYAFSIPSFQRPYSWTTVEAGALFDDLLGAAEDFSPTGKTPIAVVSPYFLGSIVLRKMELAEADVIDGQQRLTTLALLLTALSDSFEDQSRSNRYRTMLLEEGSNDHGTKDRCRLTLRNKDHAFFEDNILRPQKLDGLSSLLDSKLEDPRKRLVENTLLFAKKIAGITVERRDALAAFVLQHTYLVVVCTPDFDSAFRIFSVLNDRGLDLTAADLLKADIVGKIPEGKQHNECLEMWEDFEADLGTSKFTDLFSHLRMIHTRTKPRTSILVGVKESIPLVKEPERFIRELLKPAAEAFSVLLHQQFEGSDRRSNNRINACLRRLARLDDVDWMPPAIYFLSRPQASPPDVEVFLRDMERLCVAMWLMRFDVNDRIRRHALILDAIDSKLDLAADGSPLQLSDKEIQKTKEVLDGEIYTLTPKMKRTMILLRLDEMKSSGEATYDYPFITIEHVLPQTPPVGSQWCEWWPDQQIRERNVHRLGNLALLNKKQNPAAKNYEFEVKKNKYFFGKSGASPFAITTEIVSRKSWTVEDFEERQASFLKVLCEEWRLTPMAQV